MLFLLDGFFFYFFFFLEMTRLFSKRPEDPSAIVRRKAVALLRALRLAHPEVLNAVCGRVSDADDGIRRLAMEALPDIIQDDVAGVQAVRKLGSLGSLKRLSLQPPLVPLQVPIASSRLQLVWFVFPFCPNRKKAVQRV